MIVFPEVPRGDDVRVSASSFVMFNQCPERAAAHYRGVYGPETRASFSGGLAHRVFARHLQEGEIAPGRFEQVCREEIGSSNLNFKMGEVGLKPSGLDRVIEEVGLLYERFKRLSVAGFEAAEVSFTLEPLDGVELVGRVDAVFDDQRGHVLVDWKTGALGEAAQQLGFYALLWTLESGDPPGAVEAVSVATGERYSEVPGRIEVQEVADSVAAMITSLRDTWRRGDTFERRGGPWCRYCPVLDGCNEGAAATRLDG